MTAKERKRKYQREYMRKYYIDNQASLGLHKRGRPAKVRTLKRPSGSAAARKGARHG